MAKSEEKRYFSQNFKFKVNRHDIAKSIAAAIYNPYKVRKGIEHLYEEDSTYNHIFSERPATQIIAFFWLHKFIRKESNQERYYSIWHVLRSIYDDFKPIFDKKNKYIQNAFIYICERQIKANHSDILDSFREAIDIYFDLYVKDFFNYCQKKTNEPLDINSFFKTHSLILDFEKFLKDKGPKEKIKKIKKCKSYFIDKLQYFEYN